MIPRFCHAVACKRKSLILAYMTDTDGRYIAVEEIRPIAGYRLWLLFNDGISGEVDVSDFLDHPQFGRWSDEDFFKSVSLDAGSPVWDEIIDLSPRMLYRRLTGCRPCDINPSGHAEAMAALKQRVRERSGNLVA